MADFTDEEVMGLSDDEIMNMAQPPSMTAAEPVEPAEVVEQPSGAPSEPTKDTVDPSGSTDLPEGDEADDAAAEGDENPLNKKDEDVSAAEKPKAKEKPKAEDTAEVKAEEPAKAEEGDAAAEPQPVDYQKFHEQMTAEFKAGGRKMKITSPEEAISLMQRGADYTRKMQALKPNLKLMKMLENNGLLDEAKLAHFIDLDKKDPAAIAKFLRDKQVDPLDLDMSQETAYKPGNHSVSDEEMQFNSALEDIQSTPSGRETVQIIDKHWDRASQGKVFKEPAIMKLIDTHREDGWYDQITSEMDRLKLVGAIPENTPFLEAYRAVGDELHKAGRLLKDGVPTNQKKPAVEQPANPPVQTPAALQTNQRPVIASRPAAPKPAASNAAAVRAAAPTRTTPAKPAKADYNPLSMSDEEFEKQAGTGSFQL